MHENPKISWSPPNFKSLVLSAPFVWWAPYCKNFIVITLYCEHLITYCKTYIVTTFCILSTLLQDVKKNLIARCDVFKDFQLRQEVVREFHVGNALVKRKLNQNALVCSKVQKSEFEKVCLNLVHIKMLLAKLSLSTCTPQKKLNQVPQTNKCLVSPPLRCKSALASSSGSPTGQMTC